MMPLPIPPIAHFIWFGRRLEWVHLFALRSAIQRGGFARVILHHADDRGDSQQWAALDALPHFEARRLAPEGLLEQARGAELVDVYRDLEEPAGRANVVRAALLAVEGGVYLDADTVTLASFSTLREPGGSFCGAERIIRPVAVTSDRRLSTKFSSLVRRGARSALREIPGGWRAFRHIERFYPAAVNNAVLGSEARHPFLAALLENMVQLPQAQRRIRYSLGTHLLQRTAREYQGGDLRVLPPAVFYPLGPEISLHWFRRTREAMLGEILLPETVLVHWYASVRTRQMVSVITPDYVRAHAGTQLFSALALPFV